MRLSVLLTLQLRTTAQQERQEKATPLRAKPVIVAIDQDKEIVEELEQKDISLYGVDGVLERRARNHVQMLANELDRAFFTEAYNSAENSIVIDETLNIAEMLESVIQQCENRILVVCIAKLFYQWLETVHIRCVLPYIKYRYIFIT